MVWTSAADWPGPIWIEPLVILNEVKNLGTVWWRREDPSLPLWNPEGPHSGS